MPDLRRTSGTVHRSFRIFGHMGERFFILPVVALLLGACNSEIYLRDGVTDGDTFYLAERALADSDPAYQSWVRYNLSRSACQLQASGDNPARSNSYACELGARRTLAGAWQEKKDLDPALTDAYLDGLLRIQEAGFLGEYVAEHFSARRWSIPGDLDPVAYRSWARRHLQHHDPQTRITGSWNYSRNVSPY